MRLSRLCGSFMANRRNYAWVASSAQFLLAPRMLTKHKKDGVACGMSRAYKITRLVVKCTGNSTDGARYECRFVVHTIYDHPCGVTMPSG